MSTDETQDEAAVDEVEDVEAEIVDSTDDVDEAEAAEPAGPEEIIAALKREVEDQRDRNLRLRADFDNLRKRSVRDAADARAMSKITTIETFLPVFDHFGMALDMINTADNVAMIQQGMNMIGTEFERGFQSLGVERLKSVGERFDPNLHDALQQVERDDIDPGTIVAELVPGYRVGERLLRPAMVVVARPPSGGDDEDAPAAN